MPLSAGTTFAASFFVNFAVAALLFVLLGGRQLMSRRAAMAGVSDGIPDGVPAGSVGAMSNIRTIGQSTPQGGAQVYGDAEAEIAPRGA